MAKANTTPATESATESTAATEATEATTGSPQGDVIGYDSESATYAAVMETLGDFRVCIKAAEVLGTKLESLAKVQPALPLAIAGKGLVALGDFVADESAELCDAGSDGFMVSAIGARGITGEDGKARNGIRGLAVYPAYSVDAILAHNGGAAWLLNLAEKELGHIAFRGLRGDIAQATLEDMHAAAQAMPVDLADFIERAAQGTGSPFAVFNDNWVAFLAKSVEKGVVSKELKANLPRSKREMLNCIRSSQYAETHFAALEQAANGSIFVALGRALAGIIARVQEQAIEAGQEPAMKGDPASILTWIENRDSLVLEVTSVSEDALNIDMAAFGL